MPAPFHSADRMADADRAWNDVLAEARIGGIEPALRDACGSIADHIGRCRALRRTPLVVGICGPQGSGKSTIAALLAARLSVCDQLRVAVLSLDDFYLSHAARQRLALTTHPLLATRGVPGTHDVDHALATIRDLVGNDDDTAVTLLPRFDKATDDPRPVATWPRMHGRVDVVLFEGWCVGAQAQTGIQLGAAINPLEALQDADGAWRRHVNAALAGPYAALFGTLDLLMLIAAPGFDCVFDWRREQERKLAAHHAQSGEAAPALMDDAALARFIMHYERITRHVLAEMPGRADIVLRIEPNRQVVELTLRPLRQPDIDAPD